MHIEQKDYEHLHHLSREIRVLRGIASLLDWDHETYMPADAVGIRAEQVKVLSGIIHKKEVSKEFANALSKLINLKTGRVLARRLTPAQGTALKEWRRDYLRENSLPKRFVEEFTQLTSQATHVWRHARQHNSFQQFAPFLEKIVAMSRKKADLIGYKEHPYDALLDLYEPNTTTNQIKVLFSHLRKSITGLLKKILATQKVDDSFLFGNFDREQQLNFAKLILKAMDYDMSKGRLDISAHPFSSSCHPTDSRITTKIHPTALMSNISAVMHEAGHSLYEMGLPVDGYGSPLGESVSLGMHESQSRWWETLIGHNRSFWQHFLPVLKKHFPQQLENVSLDKFHRAINKVTPSLIRIEADEVTYSLHVILRFEMEKALIEGSLAVRDVPEAWNGLMQELLGLTPTTNSEGCLQDIHWSMGGFGYFPTYTLGNLYASHLFLGFAQAHPDWEERLTKGDLGFIKYWLHQHVYQYGRQYSSQELVQKASGKPFSADAFTTYLTRKYSK